ncbi:hypothetical protein D3C74_431590 [compost metagenome]
MSGERNDQEGGEANPHHQVAELSGAEVPGERTGQHAVPCKSQTGHEQQHNPGHIGQLNAAPFHNKDKHNAKY